jgi:uncharacterized membrane protein YgaE (UPF0421/DUF939 family)
MILIPLIAFWVAVLTLKWLFDHLDDRGRLFLVSTCLGAGVYALIGMLVSPSHPVTWHILLGFAVAVLVFTLGSTALGGRNGFK